MESQTQNLYSLVEAYKEQYRRIEHLDRVVLIVFAIFTLMLLALLVVLGLAMIPDKWSQLGAMLLVMTLAAAGAHTTVGNAGDYWVTFVVIAQLTRGLGLVSRGVFPASLLAQAPVGLSGYVRRLLGGLRGPILMTYLSFGWYGSFLALSRWAEGLVAFGLAFLPPLVLVGLSTAFCYARLRYQLVSLRRHEELAMASRDELASRHCDLAEALLFLDPPRLMHAKRQYELALEIDPENPRAREGLRRLAS